MVTHFTVIGLGGSPNETFFLHNLLCRRLATALSTGQPDRCELQPAAEVSQFPM
jgi:hypothetical protein